jgi:hypothetical protein
LRWSLRESLDRVDALLIRRERGRRTARRTGSRMKSCPRSRDYGSRRHFGRESRFLSMKFGTRFTSWDRFWFMPFRRSHRGWFPPTSKSLAVRKGLIRSRSNRRRGRASALDPGWEATATATHS